MSIAHSPLRYPGGKNCIFPFVSSLIAENGLTGCKYIEPYAGGAGLALRLLFEEYAGTIIINDLDPLVHAFWCMCIKDPERFIAWIERTPIDVSTWKRCREKIRQRDAEDDFDLATSFFFLNRTNVSGVLKGGVIGGLDQTGNYKIDARFNKVELIRKVEKIARFSNRIRVENLDGVELIKSCAADKTESFVYLDPPYYQKGANLYLNAFKDADHEKLAKYVTKLSTPWMLSYDNHSFITNLYQRFEKRAYKLQHSTSNKIGDEVLIFSKKTKFQESLSYLNSVVTV
jgi:DNA adenine methylase